MKLNLDISDIVRSIMHPFQFKKVDVNEFEKLLKGNGVVRLDVRNANEYNEAHIAGSKNIPVLDDNFETIAKDVLPRHKAIAVYCKVGVLSKMAADFLVDSGYKVYLLDTGLDGWIAAGKSVVRDGSAE